MPISRVDCGAACKLHVTLDPLSPQWHPSRTPITSLRGASSHSDTMVEAQIGSMQTSVVRLRQCNSCATSRMRTIKARRAFSVSNAASTSAKQAVQDDQVELGKTGQPCYRSQHTSSGRSSNVVTSWSFSQSHVGLCMICRHQGEFAGYWCMAVGGQELLGL